MFNEKEYLEKECKRLKNEVKKTKKEGIAWKIELAEKSLKKFEERCKA
jgi:hypothetical protein